MKKLLLKSIVLFLAGGITGSLTNPGYCSNLKEKVISADKVMQAVRRGQIIRVDSFGLKIISPSSGVQFYGDGILFLSQSKDETGMLPGHVSFGTIQTNYGVLNDSSVIDQRLFIPATSFPYPSEAITFNRDYTMMLYTMLERNNSAEKIWAAHYTGGETKRERWTFDDKPLDFCTGNSVYTHPALSYDASFLVFASNMEGTMGEMDLFIAQRDGTNWKEPVNLGNYINSAGNELFPFLDAENNLFFSSDGRGGAGGYDIFMCRFDGRGWAYPVNITQVINTPADDIAFTISRTDGRMAFFTTREKSRSQNMQLFRIGLETENLTSDIKNLSGAFSAIAPPDPATEKYITGIMGEKVSLFAEKTEEKTEPALKEAEVKLLSEQKAAEEKIEKIQEAEKQAEVKKTDVPVVQKTEPEPVKEQTKPVQPTETVKQVTGELLYRVQFSASMKPLGPYQITIGGTSYTTYEYLYAGAYRSCAGEFITLKEAVSLQSAMRKAGFDQAFVVAFRNGERVVNYR